ncbi:DUF4091 domain-containing protein [Paenibacillus hamazuiensis]|uniref:DUF4091 domain-containing protein n=1 Tax=Paenibacillus hamazuiensis TaxID=2936508 RepID=UPI00200F09FC|nr:DUF4091 domain-containing protein [Paenibacillus hamazuiensis]
MYAGLQSMFYKYANGYGGWEEHRQAAACKHKELVCLRRDSAALQAVVSADEPFLLTVSEDTLFWKGGPLPIVRLEVEMDGPLGIKVHLIGLTPDDDGLHKSDVLLEQSSLYVAARQVQQVWIELEAGAGVPPAMYEGKIRLYRHTMFEDERLMEELIFTVSVREDMLPEPKDYRFYLDLWQHPSNIARKYDAELWSEEHFAILDRYLASLAALGQKALSVVVSEIPWSGQFSHMDGEPSDLFEYSIVRTVRRKDGTFSYDYSALDRYIELGERHGISSEIEVFGLLNIWQKDMYGAIVDGYPDGIRIRYFDEADRSYKFIREREPLERYIVSLEAHFAVKGWVQRVRILADEPSDIELFRLRTERLRRLAPSFRLKVAINHQEFLHEPLEGMHDAVPILHCALEYTGGPPTVPGRRLFYVCCYPDKPNTFLRSPALESRLLPWLAEELGYDGMLRWNYTVWPDEPMRSVRYRPSVWPAGDTNFVYPGRRGSPLLSLRYKWLQRGIRDFEYMQLLKETGRETAVLAARSCVFRYAKAADIVSGGPDTQPYSLDPDDYDSLYRQE